MKIPLVRAVPIAVFILLTRTVFVVGAEEPPPRSIDWYRSVSDAFSAAAEQDRPVFAVISAGAWCDPCRWVQDNTFADRRLVDFVRAHTVPLWLWEHEAAHESVPFDRVPTVLLLTPVDGKVALQLSGAVSSQSLLTSLEREVGPAPDDNRPRPPGARPTAMSRYRFGGGLLERRSDGTWHTTDAGLPPTLERYQEDDEYFYLRNVGAGTFIAVPRTGGDVWRWNAEIRDWEPFGSATPVEP